MTVELRQRANVSVGSGPWLEALARCVDAIGFEDFPQELVGALRSLVDIDYSVSFAYYRSERPLCLFHTFDPDQKIVFVDEYMQGPYCLDPFYNICRRKIENGLYRLRDISPDRFYQSEYYRSYYIQTGLSEEICYTFYLSKGIAVVISLMRSGASSRFSAREFRLLKSVTPIIVSLAQRHWHDVPKEFDEKASVDPRHDDHSEIEHSVAEVFEQRITPREIQVAAQVLEGHSSESIGKSLGISVGTVRIHRRNMYAKLQISSQQELFFTFVKKVTAER